MPYRSITIIEDEIITALTAALTGDGTAQVKTLKTYGGELSGDDVNALARHLPAVFVIYNGSRYEDHGSTRREFIRYVLFVADKSLRSEAEARRGLDLNPGTYKILNDCRDALYGKDFALDIDPFRLVSEQNIYTDNVLSVYSQEWETAQTHYYSFQEEA